MASQEVTQEYKESMVDFLQYLYEGELWAGNAAAYWMNYVPLDSDLHQTRLKLGKMAYDEVRHADICRRMIQHFGGDEALREHDEQLSEDVTANSMTGNYFGQLSYCHTQGPDDFIEFLPTVPLFADATAQRGYEYQAATTPDPLWSDAVESIAQDERMHGSISMEAIPIVIEKYGEEAKERLQRGLDRFALTLYSVLVTNPNEEGNPYRGDSGDIYGDRPYDPEEVLYENLHEVFDPYPDITIPEFEPEDAIYFEHLGDYAVKVANNPNITYHHTVE